MKIKTIDIYAKEWFDRINRNSYFSAEVILNYKLKEIRKYFEFAQGFNIIQDKEKVITIPFQYGYNDRYIEEATAVLMKNNYIKPKRHLVLWRYCEENGIILRTYKQRNCKRQELGEE